MPNSPWIFFGNNARLIPTGDLIAADGTTIINGKSQRGRTQIDQSVAVGVSGDVTVSIALDASYYTFGTCLIYVPRAGTLSFVNPTTAEKQGMASSIWFTTVASDSHALTTTEFGLNTYPGYADRAFAPYGYDQLQEGFLSSLAFASNGGFGTLGAPLAPLVRIISVRINGSNIDIVFNKATTAGTASLAYIVDWRVWKP